jgi:hypothetical protein
METLATVVGRERRSDRPAVETGDGRPYSYRTFCTETWKAANLFRYNGLVAGRTLGVADVPAVQPLVAAFGAALLGAAVRFDPPADTDVRAILAPVDRVGDYDLPPGGQRFAFGGVPDDPEVEQFERGIWSENPTVPPREVEPDATALVTDRSVYTHAAILAATEDVVAEYAIDQTDVVALRFSLRRPGTVVAGVIAPLVAGASILLSDGDDPTDSTGTLAVGDAQVPEETAISPEAVSL